jgi:hypothetical protein
LKKIEHLQENEEPEEQQEEFVSVDSDKDEQRAPLMLSKKKIQKSNDQGPMLRDRIIKKQADMNLS